MFALISSPGQYFNLLEFIYQNKINQDSVILIYFKSEKEFEGDFNYYAFETFKKIYVINQRKKNLIGFLKWYFNIFFHLILYLIHFEKILISSQIWSNYHMIFSYLTKNEKIFSLDDGNANLITFDYNYSPKAFLIRNKINHFSLLSLPFEKVKKNRLLLLKSKLSKTKYSIDKIFIVGSPFVSDGYMSKEVYNNKISHVINKFNKKYEIIYMPHRRENQTDYLEIKGLSILNSNGCFELWMLNQNTIPKTFVTFGSGLSLTIDSLFGNKLNQYILQFEDIDFLKSNSFVKDYLKVCDYYKKNIQSMKAL